MFLVNATLTWPIISYLKISGDRVRHGRWREIQHSSYAPGAPCAQEEPPARPGQAEEPWSEWCACDNIHRLPERVSPPHPPQGGERHWLPLVSRNAAGRVGREEEECHCPICHHPRPELGGRHVPPEQFAGVSVQPELRWGEVQRTALPQCSAQAPKPLGGPSHGPLWRPRDDGLPAEEPPQGSGLSRPHSPHSDTNLRAPLGSPAPPATQQHCNAFLDLFLDLRYCRVTGISTDMPLWAVTRPFKFWFFKANPNWGVTALQSYKREWGMSKWGSFLWLTMNWISFPVALFFCFALFTLAVILLNQFFSPPPLLPLWEAYCTNDPSQQSTFVEDSFPYNL